MHTKIHSKAFFNVFQDHSKSNLRCQVRKSFHIKHGVNIKFVIKIECVLPCEKNSIYWRFNHFPVNKNQMLMFSTFSTFNNVKNFQKIFRLALNVKQKINHKSKSGFSMTFFFSSAGLGVCRWNSIVLTCKQKAKTQYPRQQFTSKRLLFHR